MDIVMVGVHAFKISPHGCDGRAACHGKDGDALGVDGAQVGVLEEADQVGLCSPPASAMTADLEAQVGLEVLRDLADEALEGQLADEQLGALLVATDLAQGDGAGPVAMRLLDAAGGRRALASGLGSRAASWGPFLRSSCEQFVWCVP